MRLVAGVLALTLFASFARAEDTKTPEPTEPAGSTSPAGPAADVTYRKVPLRVVRVMAQSHQALLFDRSRATHVLAEVGSKIDGYSVEAIDDDEVTLSFEGKQIVLAAPPRGGNRRHDRDVPAMRAPSAAGARQTDPVASEPAPIDPYGDTPVRVTEAPGASGVVEPGHPSRVIEAGQGGVRVAEAPGGTASPSHRPAEMPVPHPVALAAKPADAGPVDAKPAGIRVAEAPPSSPSAAPNAPSSPSAAPSATTTQPRDAQAAHAPTGQGGIRVAEAPAGVPSVPPGIEARPVPSSPSGIEARPVPSSPSGIEARPVPSSPSGIEARPVPSSPPGIEARPVPSGPPVIEARPVPSSPPAIEARPTAPRSPEVPAIKAPDVRAADAARAPDKQTLDARAMADVMSADSRPRRARAPASGPASGSLRTVTPAADPRPAIPGPPASDIRTASAAPGNAVVLSRSEVDGALADFARLAAAVRGSFSASGLTVDAVAEGSLFARAGLRAGDVVSAVDGAPLRSLDAAANLYARASSTKALTAQIVRGGSPMTLHVAIQ